MQLRALLRKALIAQPVEKVKTDTPAWMKTFGPRYAEFHRQGGSSAFSVSESIAPKVREYMRNQREHHQERSFQDQLRALLKKHGVAFEERYVSD